MADGSDVKVTVTIEPEDARKMATEVVALREELADVRAQWQADVGSAIARAQTAEARAARLNTEIGYLFEENEEMGRREMQRAAAARKMAQWVRSEIDEYRLDVEDAHQRRYKVQAERDFARAEAARLRASLTELVDLMQATINGEYTPDSFTLQPARAALRGPAQSEQPAARRQEANDDN